VAAVNGNCNTRDADTELHGQSFTLQHQPWRSTTQPDQIRRIILWIVTLTSDSQNLIPAFRFVIVNVLDVLKLKGTITFSAAAKRRVA